MIAVSLLAKNSKQYEARAKRAASCLMKELGQEGKTLEIFIVGNEQLPKNVLAFPADPSFPRPDLTEPALGEIYLNPEYISEHEEDFEFMLVHGFLHLLGYDHMEKSDRITMEKEEQRLVKLLPRRS